MKQQPSQYSSGARGGSAVGQGATLDRGEGAGSTSQPVAWERLEVRLDNAAQGQGSSIEFLPGAMGPTVGMQSVEALARFMKRIAMRFKPEGFTLDPGTLEEPPAGEVTYWVSLHGHGEVFDHLPREREILCWLIRVKPVLFRPAHYVGTWWFRQMGLYYLDITIPVEGYEQAMAVARANGQKSIYHPATGEVYFVEPEALPAAA